MDHALDQMLQWQDEWAEQDEIHDEKYRCVDCGKSSVVLEESRRCPECEVTVTRSFICHECGKPRAIARWDFEAGMCVYCAEYLTGGDDDRNDDSRGTRPCAVVRHQAVGR